MPTERFAIRGLSEERDAQRVRHALGEVWGIREVTVDASRGEVMFTWDERAASPQDFRQALESSGFKIEGERPSP